MDSVKRLAEQAQYRLNDVLPHLRKTVVGKLALVVGAMLEKQTPICRHPKTAWLVGEDP